MEKTFEENLKVLEETVTELESGECGLDKSIELYTKGVKLAKELKEKLENAQRTVEIVETSEEN